MERVLNLTPRLKSKPDDKAKILEALRKITELVEGDEISSLTLIAVRSDGTWMYDFAGDTSVSQMVGFLEIIKVGWIKSYIHSED